MRKSNVIILVLSLIIPLLVGGISAALSSQGMVAYGNMNKPPLSPPPWVFSVAWTILYLIMGLASYFIVTAGPGSKGKGMLITAYIVQLIMNFMWSLIFFNHKLYFVAFIWLMVMWLIVIFCAIGFYSIKKTATYLFIPYIVWLTFAAYLNLGTYLLNK